MSQYGSSKYPAIRNEAMLDYAPGSPERANFLHACQAIRASPPRVVPCIVNGREVTTGAVFDQAAPSDHRVKVAQVHEAPAALLRQAVEGALAVRGMWREMPFEDRAAIFLKAGDLAATKYRAALCAATALGMGKTAWQAEIDSAAELIDFWRFAPKFAQEVYQVQPSEQSSFCWNRMEALPLEGFIAAIAPFNFTAIGGNLASAPAMMGNVVVWKPESKAALSSMVVMDILREAGLPDGVIQFVPSHGPTFGDTVIPHRMLSGVHFTGSTATFRHLWRQVGNNIGGYAGYPRLVGETGGKDFHLVSSCADLRNAAWETVRGAFEFAGQKCSAPSRCYIPQSKADEFLELVRGCLAKEVTVGQPDDMKSFTSAVIDEKAFDRCVGYIERARASPECRIVAGGTYDKSRGYFVQPTVILTTNPQYESMREEIFGPILTVYAYPDSLPWGQVCALVNTTSDYALTGAIFATDRQRIAQATKELAFAAGNFYINNKSTGAVVAQQPFSGGRASGTGDKAGSQVNMWRWVNWRTIKESTIPLKRLGYPSVDQ
jgi:1-pyrroline-5-carboxylate dehydrogenase